MSLPVVVWLRGPAGTEIPADAHVTRDRTAAWHLARGGCPAVELDVSPVDVSGLDTDLVRMRVVRPVWAEYDDGVTAMEWAEVSDRSFPRARPLDVEQVAAELGRLVDELSDRTGMTGTGVGVDAVRDAAQGLRDASHARDATIVATVDAGVPIARVADAAGLSRQAVYSIARGWTRPDRRE